MRAVPRSLLFGLCLATLLSTGCDEVVTPENLDRLLLEDTMDCSVRMVSLGAVNEGVLEPSSCRTHGVGPYISFYGLRLEEGDVGAAEYLRIDMITDDPDLDPRLILLSSDGQTQIATNNDISPTNRNAQIRIRGLTPNLYAIAAMATTGQTGHFLFRTEREASE